MGKTLTCPFCFNRDTLKVVYCYRGHKIRNKQRNKYKEDEASTLLKDGTIYRAERPKYIKYDFDGEKIKAPLYNKYCPKCNTYFYSMSKMATIDIAKVIIIYEVNRNRHRYDFDFSNSEEAKYTYKNNYVLLAENIILTSAERYNILKSIKESKMNFWNKEYNNLEYSKYRWIIKLEYANGLSECYFGYDVVSDKWDIFISGFKDIFYRHDKKKDVDKLK